MKKILLFIILLICSLNIAKPQCRLPYKELSGFASDTTAFVKYNFGNRAECYEGKTLEYLLTDLQITPILSGMGFTLGESEEVSFTSLRLYLSKGGGNSLYIHLRWEKPVPMDRYMKKLLEKYGFNSWGPRYRQTFGDYIVSDVSIGLNVDN